MGSNKKRRIYTAEFKAKVALEALKGELTTNQIAERFAVHRSQVLAWKRLVRQGLPSLFITPKETSKAPIGKGLDSDDAKDFERLKNEYGWVKKQLLLLSSKQKLILIERGSNDVSIRMQCKILNLNRSLLFYKKQKKD